MLSAAEKLSQAYGSFTCLALVKPHSSLSSEWELDKPAYCILEYSAAFGKVDIRWGDGSGQKLNNENELDGLILLHQFDEDEINKLFY